MWSQLKILHIIICIWCSTDYNIIKSTINIVEEWNTKVSPEIMTTFRDGITIAFYNQAIVMHTVIVMAGSRWRNCVVIGIPIQALSKISIKSIANCTHTQSVSRSVVPT